MTDKFNAGFVRDEQGRLVLAEPGAEEGWISGFVRDIEGRLVVVGPGGESIGDGELAAAVLSRGLGVNIESAGAYEERSPFFANEIFIGKTDPAVKINGDIWMDTSA